MAPDVPADRVAALRKAFMETMKDQELLAEAQRIGLAIDPISGEDLQKLAADIFATPRAVRREDQGRDGLPGAVNAPPIDGPFCQKSVGPSS